MPFSQPSKPASEEKPSYWWEMIKHPWNVTGAGVALIAGAVLSVPFGIGAGLVPLVAFGAVEGIASLFIPSRRGFKE